jgi:hypothetical protein
MVSWGEGVGMKTERIISDAQGQVLQTDVSVRPNPFSLVEIAMDRKGVALGRRGPGRVEGDGDGRMAVVSP